MGKRLKCDFAKDLVISGTDLQKISLVRYKKIFGVVGSFHVSFPISRSTCATLAAGAALSKMAE